MVNYNQMMPEPIELIRITAELTTDSFRAYIREFDAVKEGLNIHYNVKHGVAVKPMADLNTPSIMFNNSNIILGTVFCLKPNISLAKERLIKSINKQVKTLEQNIVLFKLNLKDIRTSYVK